MIYKFFSVSNNCRRRLPVTFSLGINSTTGWLLRRESTSTWPPPPYWKNQIKNTSSRNYFILLRKFNCQTANFNINQRGILLYSLRWPPNHHQHSQLLQKVFPPFSTCIMHVGFLLCRCGRAEENAVIVATHVLQSFRDKLWNINPRRRRRTFEVFMLLGADANGRLMCFCKKCTTICVLCTSKGWIYI